MSDDVFETWQRMFDAPLESVTRAARVGTTPHDVVYREGTLQVLRYRSERPIEWVDPVLICFALVNRPYILDLQPGRSVVQRLLERGFDVYLIDWGAPGPADCGLGLYDYVCRFLKNVSDVVCARSGGGRLNLLGYCMGGTMSAMYTSLYPDQVRNLILMAAPIDFCGDGLLNVWADEKYFDVDAFVDAYGNCPGTFLQACFRMMKPMQNFHEKYTRFLHNVHDAEFVENFAAMEKWSSDNIPVAGETFRQFVKWLYQQNQLVEGKLALNSLPVDLRRITCPLLLLTADFDHLTPPASSLALRDHVRSCDVQSLSLAAGHVGLAVSSKAHARLWPEAAEWIAARSTPRKNLT